MATSFLTSSQTSSLAGVFARSFQTFSNDRAKTIVIYKESKKVITSQSAVSYPGYQNSSNSSNITSYVPVSGTYPAMVFIVGEQESKTLEDPKVSIPKNAKIKIKVEQDCSTFIENGKTEKIILNGDTYNIAGEREVDSFLTLNYFVYYLEKTN